MKVETDARILVLVVRGSVKGVGILNCFYFSDPVKHKQGNRCCFCILTIMVLTFFLHYNVITSFLSSLSSLGSSSNFLLNVFQTHSPQSYLLICLCVYMYSPRCTLLSLYTVTCVGGFRADPLVLDKQLCALPWRRPPSHCRHSLVTCRCLCVRGPDRPLPALTCLLLLSLFTSGLGYVGDTLWV